MYATVHSPDNQLVSEDDVVERLVWNLSDEPAVYAAYHQ